MSISSPLPSQAPAAMSSAGNTVMSWQESLVGDGPHGIPDGCNGAGLAF